MTYNHIIVSCIQQQETVYGHITTQKQSNCGSFTSELLLLSKHRIIVAVCSLLQIPIVHHEKE